MDLRIAKYNYLSSECFLHVMLLPDLNVVSVNLFILEPEMLCDKLFKRDGEESTTKVWQLLHLKNVRNFRVSHQNI